MGVKRIIAANMQQGLKLISQELGPDAVILSNKRIAEGVEILASVEETQTIGEVNPDIGLPLQNAQPTLKERAQEAIDSPAAMSDLLTSIRQNKEKATSERTQIEAIEAEKLEQQKSTLADMQAEIESLKALLAEKEAIDPELEEVPSKPIEIELTEQQSQLQERLVKMGFSPVIAKNFCATAAQQTTIQMAWKDLLKTIVDESFLMPNNPVDHGGIWAFTGPTGGGKSTTIAKIAAQYVMKHKRKDVVLISLDTFRIGAQEQLKVLSKILDVPFFSVTPEQSLADLLAANMRNKLVLIDTGGCAKGLQLFDNQLQNCTDFRINQVFVAPTTTQNWLMDRWLEQSPINKIDAAVVTKVDEAHFVGGVLGLCAERQIPLLAWCNGQDVPADIQFGQLQKLISVAVQFAKETNIMKQKEFFAA